MNSMTQTLSPFLWQDSLTHRHTEASLKHLSHSCLTLVFWFAPLSVAGQVRHLFTTKYRAYYYTAATSS